MLEKSGMKATYSTGSIGPGGALPHRRAEPLLLGWCFVMLGLGVVPALVGPTRPQIDGDYWQWCVPCAIAGVGLVGWMFQRMLLGRNFGFVAHQRT